MGTHPIFESDFDCLTDFDSMGCRLLKGARHIQRTRSSRYRSDKQNKQTLFDEYFEKATLSQRKRSIRKKVFLIISTGGTFGYVHFVNLSHSARREELFDELSESESFLLKSLLNLFDSYRSPFVYNNPAGIPRADFLGNIHLTLLASVFCFTSFLTFLGRTHRRASIKFWSDLVSNKKKSIVQLYTNRLNGEVLFVGAPEKTIVSGCLERGMELNQTRNWLWQFVRDSERYLTPWWKEISSDILWSIGCSSLIFLALYQSSRETRADHEPKMIATLTLLLTMDEFRELVSERLINLQQALKTNDITSILSRDNIHLITSYLLDDLNCYASQSFLDKLSQTINYRSSMSSKYYLKQEDKMFEDYYRSHIIYKLLGRLDLITWNINRSSVGFNSSYIIPNILTILQI